MFDKNKLEYLMKSKGVTVNEMCEVCGIGRSAWYRKLRGATEFTLKEVRAISDVLGEECREEIFFAEKVS